MWRIIYCFHLLVLRGSIKHCNRVRMGVSFQRNKEWWRSNRRTVTVPEREIYNLFRKYQIYFHLQKLVNNFSNIPLTFTSCYSSGNDVSIPQHRTIRVKRFQPRIRWLIWIPTPKWVIFVLKTNCLFVVIHTMARFNYSRDCCCDKAGAVKWASTCMCVCVCRMWGAINSDNDRRLGSRARIRKLIEILVSVFWLKCMWKGRQFIRWIVEM